ncbi:hypothetical protein AA14337_3066 [Acetobacter malorum DSM 14337]|uniref:Nucleotidyl transferase AbiEii/AbiGii toxin family protein n=1 Tax=Acetobacter malorum DSM 14337 TaxID=1307910 RepID=A0ABQ0PZF8_9PROT|nr:nucleotidyl transferase AbiEii/AbiGii toxin family protein [Acetobacter malorum]KXV05655.1 hypothetical protein AD930_11000 [Acetobacter malorum]GBQ85417.1 hypothetical protein AA14337_3066 [Acetobacter malorum DSM 14337]
MAKTVLSATDAFNFRQTLHVATLEALVSSRRWRPGDLIFQGGTSLHLAYGSPRFSEDLDFMVNEDLNLNSIASSVKSRLSVSGALPRDMDLTISKIKTEKNPLSFLVNLGRPDVMGTVQVKVELWKAPSSSLENIDALITPVRLGYGPSAGLTAQVNVASINEIYADKVFAVAARGHLKARDVFDLYWIRKQGQASQVSEDSLETRLDIYPSEDPENWLEKASSRFASMPGDVDAIYRDLQRWLPRSWPLSKEIAAEMIEESRLALSDGINVMQELVRERTCRLDREANQYDGPSL